jgi:hypothetical protein
VIGPHPKSFAPGEQVVALFGGANYSHAEQGDRNL